jgi:LacI family transcriptional regulator
LKIANIDDVALLASVSIKTVSRVVNKEPNVREETAKRVNKAIKELNYRPNPSARNLASNRSYLIALLYDDPSFYDNPSSNYIINLQQGALRVCKSENYDLLIRPCDYTDKNLDTEILSLISNSRIDGVILAPPLSDLTSLVNKIKQTGTPMVRISPNDKVDSSFSVVTNDQEACANMTEYLASLGHKRIAFITGHCDHKALKNRLKGYENGLKKSGIKYLKSLVKEGDNSFHSGELCAEKLLIGKNPPTAIFVANDDMATGVLYYAHKAGIKIPEELSVAGFDDIPLSQQIYPTLTTIRQPVCSMTERAVEILMDKVRSRPAKNRPNMIKTTIKLRDSTGPLPTYTTT